MSLFLSLCWGETVEGERMYDMAKDANAQLQELGASTVFEEVRLQGDIDDALCEGIDNAEMVVVFVTRGYLDEVQSPSIRGLRESWCRREWNYARQNKRTSEILLVLVDPKLMDPVNYKEFIDFTDGHTFMDFSNGSWDVEEIMESLDTLRNDRTGSGISLARRPSMREVPEDWETDVRKLYYPDGKLKYEGTILFDKMHGTGTYFFRNGDMYEGEFEDDYFHGKGVFTYESGERFEGEFKFDLRHGFGKIFRDNGNLRFEGEYRNGVRDGRGTHYTVEGEKAFDGTWERGHLIEAPEVELLGRNSPSTSVSSTASTTSAQSSGSRRRSSLSRAASAVRRSVRIGRFKIDP